ncbi:MAG: ATP-binding protein [Myxococcota bacterium]
MEHPFALEGVLNSLREGLQVLSPELRYLYVNDAVCEHGRTTREALLGHTMSEVYPGIEHTELYARLTTCLREQTSTAFPNRFDYPDGSVGWFELRVAPVREGLAILSLDVSGRKALEDQLAATQRLEAIGRLAGGIAHDFNNILTAIHGYGALAVRGLPPEAAADVNEILAAASRAESLVAQLLAFARKQTVEPRIIDLPARIRSMEGMFRRVLGEDVDLTVDLPADTWRAKIDPSAFEQVLMNLAINARDAMPTGGRLLMETSNVWLDESTMMVKGEHAFPGPYVVLAVSDNGVGMPPELAVRVFEPFFTTKPIGEGTGLGLSTCHGIVHQAGGYIWLYSEPGQGTTFKVYLPRVDGEPHPLPVAQPPGLTGTETVLVVEDDEQILRVVTRALRTFGYTVIGAGSVEAALAQEDAVFDLLLTDVILPRMGGKELAERWRARRPGLKVLFMSGYTPNAIVKQGVLQPGFELLQKPFTPDSLARKVRAVLDR